MAPTFLFKWSSDPSFEEGFVLISENILQNIWETYAKVSFIELSDFTNKDITFCEKHRIPDEIEVSQVKLLVILVNLLSSWEYHPTTTSNTREKNST